jgi:hypothetical protein
MGVVTVVKPGAVHLFSVHILHPIFSPIHPIFTPASRVRFSFGDAFSDSLKATPLP